MKGSLKSITVPLRDFALPAPRVGHLEPHSGSGRATAEGQEIHLRVQKRRALADPSSQAEVPISATFERDGYRFTVEGRMDGLFPSTPPRIEEIKSSFDLHDLVRRLKDDPYRHPYALQLLSYGYFFWLKDGVLPELTFHLVSSRTSDAVDLPLELDPERYRQWLDLRLAELAVDAAQGEKRAQRRRQLAAGFPFPFAEPRPGQLELIAEIEAGMAERRPMLIQAPTGLGKTVGVLYPVLKEALARGQRVVYLTPKNSLHAVAEEAVARFKEVGARVKSLCITAKGKICFHDEPLCDPESCEYARDYYDKLREHGVLEILARKRRLRARTFREIGETYRVCPFELQLDLAHEADVVVCDYNYVFAPRSAATRIAASGIDQQGKPNLVIDEAHNLPARTMDQYSPALSTALLESWREDLQRIPARFRRPGEELLDACLAAVRGCRGRGETPFRIDPPVELFWDTDAKLRAFLSRYLEADLELGADDPVLRLCYTWSSFVESLAYLKDPERDEFFATFHPDRNGGGTLKITCCDAAALIKPCYQEFGQVVAFSATLKPFEYYARLCGLDPARVRSAEFSTPFARERRKLLVIPQVSTRYSRREKNYAKIAEAVARIAALQPGNYFAFFPSFDFLERVAALFNVPDGFELLLQERRMRGDRVESLLERLRQEGAPAIAFGVQGGSFAEGVDYAGKMLIGAFVVGPPLPTYDLEREEMRRYYQKRYGAGFQYAYGIPAMAKAVQAAGRVIRSERDKGVVVLMDDRFLEPEYSASMPGDWFAEQVTELVSGSILSEVAQFWEKE
ncbi:ATP-dependent DNA helicase [Geomesophilobacter sediminis]|uniref:ATP-dependent DNA helicase n=1 Tax=Geomesophilobacter sediminis TaxID=2798584 RepID=A0A8J7IW35_9BACT|nr:ATP-dependent DNA helicase [Geomesophilobacter sediminis]MBJ6723572.1 ATP-dependent DNA helicase [Geomesophilobacter sediminis]